MHAFTFTTALAGLFALSMTAPDGLPAALVVNPDNTVPPPPNAFKVGGVATFNNYINQGSSVCYPSLDGSKVISEFALRRDFLYSRMSIDGSFY